MVLTAYGWRLIGAALRTRRARVAH
jgi:hypothetical protein